VRLITLGFIRDNLGNYHKGDIARHQTRQVIVEIIDIHEGARVHAKSRRKSRDNASSRVLSIARDVKKVLARLRVF